MIPFPANVENETEVRYLFANGLGEVSRVTREYGNSEVERLSAAGIPCALIRVTITQTFIYELENTHFPRMRDWATNRLKSVEPISEA